VRRAVRKAEKLGVTVEILKDALGIRQFYALQCQTRRKHGLPPQPFRFFQNVRKCILAEGSGIIILARLAREQSQAASFFTRGRRRFTNLGPPTKQCSNSVETTW